MQEYKAARRRFLKLTLATAALTVAGIEGFKALEKTELVSNLITARLKKGDIFIPGDKIKK